MEIVKRQTAAAAAPTRPDDCSFCIEHWCLHVEWPFNKATNTATAFIFAILPVIQVMTNMPTKVAIASEGS
jgi:hypothetical protein